MANSALAKPASAASPLRSLLLISKATPEDDEFVIWLGARLAALGYEVWADILNLRGGQDWTSELENALKDRAIKMLLVCTPNGLAKRGVLREIKIAQQVATKLGDSAFIIPLRKQAYDLTFDTALVQYVDFTENWGRSLVELVETLDTYRVPRASGAQAQIINAWRSLIATGRAETEPRPEPLVSNALPIARQPDRVGIYRIPQRHSGGTGSTIPDLKLPHVAVGSYLVGFCAARDYMAGNGGLSFDIQYEVPILEFEQKGLAAANINAVDARRHLVSLFRQHWDAYCVSAGLHSFEFAGRSVAWWLGLSLVGEALLPFPSPLGGRVVDS